MLRDLKALLMEAKQRVPPFLATLDALTDEYLQLGGIAMSLIVFMSMMDITACPELGY